MYFIHPNAHNAQSFPTVGAKAARLGMMIKHGIPVPDYRVISTRAYHRFHKSGNKEFVTELSRLLSSWQSGQGNLAVRSSAPFEDHASFSMAGQFHTYLNVRGVEHIDNAIHDCWKSLHAPLVGQYLAQFGFKTKRPAMAVILQKMLSPDFAGVLFTRHPVTGDKRYCLMEIVLGNGESLVSGTSDPVRVEMDRQDFSLAFYGNDDQITRLDEFPGFRQSLLQLLQLALKIEDLFQASQDIEWAIEDGKIWILQTRPITHAISKQRVKVDAQGQIWTDYFFAERFTRPLSPLGWNVLQKWMEKNAYRGPLQDLGFKMPKNKRLTCLIDGFPFTHISVLQNLYAMIPLPFISRDKQQALLLTGRQAWKWDTLRIVPFMVKLMLRGDFNWIAPVNLRLWRRFVAKNNRITRQLDTLLAQGQSEQVFSVTEQLTDEFLSLHRWSLTFADVFYELLKFFLKLFRLSEKPETLLGNLLSGLDDNQTLNANQDLQTCKEHQLHAFIQKYGYRSESLDIYQPTWKDNPAILKDILDKTTSRNLAATQKDINNVRIRAMDVSTRKLQVYPFWMRPFVKIVFHILLNNAQAFTLLRENQRNEWHKILSRMRDAVRLQGAYLVKQGCLTEQDDIFFLKRVELLQSWEDPKDYHALVADRKTEYLAQVNPVTTGKKNGHASANGWQCMEGFGVSKGIIRGRARIAHNFTDARQAENHDILIAHSADPAWSPIFSVISGMVLETGGILSHASVVAREFGLPTVTGIAGATHVIQEGDVVEINGETGTVKLVSKQGDDHEH